MAQAITHPPNTAQTSFKPIPDAKQAGDHYRPLPDQSKDGWIHSHARQSVLVEPMALYELWSDAKKFPLWQENVVSVTPTVGGHTHWVVGNPEDPNGKRLEFDSEITEDVPGHKLAWKTIGGDVEQFGEVTFSARSDRRGTVVTLIQHFKVGKMANAAVSVAKRGPKQTVIEDLRHFKQLAETGEIPSVKGQPHGPRGISGGIKEWLYGETNPTPPGTSEVAS
jgi:uncharacterized membrane protein